MNNNNPTTDKTPSSEVAELKRVTIALIKNKELYRESHNLEYLKSFEQDFSQIHKGALILSKAEARRILISFYSDSRLSFLASNPITRDIILKLHGYSQFNTPEIKFLKHVALLTTRHDAESLIFGPSDVLISNVIKVIGQRRKVFITAFTALSACLYFTISSHFTLFLANIVILYLVFHIAKDEGLLD
jgi:hypothetical protein